MAGDRRSRWVRGLALAVDLLILLAVVATAGRYLGRDRPQADGPSQAGPLLRLGSRFSLAGQAFTGRRTLVTFVSSRCPACQKNGSFYQALPAMAAQARVDMVVATADRPDAFHAWLGKSLGGTRVIRTPNPLADGFSSSPTLLMLDENGVVTDMAIGALDERDQGAWTARLVDREFTLPAFDNSGHPEEIGARALAGLHRVRILHVRDRERALPNVLNIPLDELASRAPVELAASTDPLAIQCERDFVPDCRVAGRVLISLRIRDVRLVVSE